jgi:UDP-glucose 4-epimerase
MKVLVIGSEGFIGNHCVNHFMRAGGWEVSGIDILTKPSGQYNYFKAFPHNTSHEEIIKDVRPDVCIYSVGSANVSQSVLNPVSDFEANAVHTYYVLNSLRLHAPHCRFINISSAAVYGSPGKLPVNEQSEIKPVSPYGWHKYYSELIASQFHVLYKMNTCSIRPFSVYGPGQNKLLFWDIYQKSLQNKEISLYGTGDESRDFLFIRDLAKGIELLANKAAMQGEVYNAGSGKETTIRDAAILFAERIKKEFSIKFTGDEKPGDPKNWRADISLIKQLGFEPATSLSEGLDLYAKWLNEKK